MLKNEELCISNDRFCRRRDESRRSARTVHAATSGARPTAAACMKYEIHHFEYKIHHFEYKIHHFEYKIHHCMSSPNDVSQEFFLKYVSEERTQTQEIDGRAAGFRE